MGIEREGKDGRGKKGDREGGGDPTNFREKLTPLILAISL